MLRCLPNCPPDQVAEFLLLDRDFPRSMHFCLIRALESLRHITDSHSGTFSGLAEQLMRRLRADLDYTSIGDVIQQGMHGYIDAFQNRLNQIGKSIQHDFFTISQESFAGKLRRKALRLVSFNCHRTRSLP